MIRSSLLLTILLAAAPVAFAQRVLVDPPVVGRPDDFSNLVGKYTITASAEPRRVVVEEPITLQVKITGEGPAKYEPQRKHLQILPDWDGDFYVENVPDEDRVLPMEKSWLFVFRLRPKHATIQEIDGIKLVYFDPESRGKNKYLSAYGVAIPITVKPKPDILPPIVTPSAVPESLYQGDETSAALAQTTPFAMNGLLFSLVILVPPVLCLAGALVWRRGHPDATTVDKRMRGARLQQLLDGLAGSRTPWTLVGRHLRQRFGFSVTDATPADVAHFLARRGFALPVSELARAFFASSDAVRFAGGVATSELSDEAARLIRALEADPCAR